MSLNFKIVQNYSQALFFNAKLAFKEDKLLEQLQFFADLMENSSFVQNILYSPVIDKNLKVKLVDLIIEHCKFEVILQRFLYVLIKNSRCNLLPQITITFNELIADSKGIKSAEILSASKLDKKEIQAIQKLLEAKLGKEITLEDKVEKSLIGGIIIKYDSNLIDCSVQSALNRIEQVALKSKI
jgi:F-type H+-transporting ATPase subunit delta